MMQETLDKIVKKLDDMENTQKDLVITLKGAPGAIGLIERFEKLETIVLGWVIPMARLKDISGFTFFIIRGLTLIALAGIGTLLWKTITMAASL
jgi:hypothetical protein